LLRRRFDRRTFASAAGAGALAVAALCGAARERAHGEGLTKLRVGVLRLSSSAPVFIAFDRGYFRQHGLDVELRFFDAAQPVAVAVAAGDIDVGVTAFTGGLFNLAGKGALKVVAGQSREAQGFPLIAYLAHPRAFAAGLRAPKDLPGHRVGMTQVGSSFHYSVGLLAAKYGFALKDVELVPLQSLANAAAALKGGRTDAALLPITVARPLIDAGDARLLGWVGDETPWQLGAVFASPRMAGDADTMQRFLDAYRSGTRDYHDVLLATVQDGEAARAPATEPLLASIAHYTGLAPEKVALGLSFIDRDGRLDVASVADQLRWYQAQGYVDAGVKLDDVIDRRYVAAP
jgi:NitT/TauT family transport system substrate-binding protein